MIIESKVYTEYLIQLISANPIRVYMASVLKINSCVTGLFHSSEYSIFFFKIKRVKGRLT